MPCWRGGRRPGRSSGKEVSTSDAPMRDVGGRWLCAWEQHPRDLCCAGLANHLLQAGVCVCVCVRAPGKASVSLCIGTKRLPWAVRYALLLDGVYVESERATSADRDDDNCLLALCYRPRCRKSPPTVSLSRCVLSPSSMLSCLRQTLDDGRRDLAYVKEPGVESAELEKIRRPLREGRKQV